MAKGVRTISLDKFCEALSAFSQGQMTIKQAAKHIGISEPTTIKYFNKFLLGEELPDNLFESKKKKKKWGRIWKNTQ